MFLDVAFGRSLFDAEQARYRRYDRTLDWTILLPFFNERAFLAATIESLSTQSKAAKIVLIDNGSTDGSGEVAVAACQRLGLAYELVVERVPGKVSALAAGLAKVRTPFVATCDADTTYPSDYLAEAEALLRQDGCVAAGAYFAAVDADRASRLKAMLRILGASTLFAGQCHTGGAGQVFRTATLRRAGGFDAKRWNYVLEDHEITHRVMKFGTMRYGAGFWCAPSPRERNRDSIKWTLGEQALYQLFVGLLGTGGDWFFYGFLSRRLRGRRLTSERIRERAFQHIGLLGHATPDPVCG